MALNVHSKLNCLTTFFLYSVIQTIISYVRKDSLYIDWHRGVFWLVLPIENDKKSICITRTHSVDAVTLFAGAPLKIAFLLFEFAFFDSSFYSSFRCKVLQIFVLYFLVFFF